MRPHQQQAQKHERHDDDALRALRAQSAQHNCDMLCNLHDLQPSQKTTSQATTKVCPAVGQRRKEATNARKEAKMQKRVVFHVDARRSSV